MTGGKDLILFRLYEVRIEVFLTIFKTYRLLKMTRKLSNSSYLETGFGRIPRLVHLYKFGNQNIWNCLPRYKGLLQIKSRNRELSLGSGGYSPLKAVSKARLPLRAAFFMDIWTATFPKYFSHAIIFVNGKVSCSMYKTDGKVVDLDWEGTFGL